MKTINNYIKKDKVMQFIIESDRLKFRKITHNDFYDLSNILQDIETMYAWEHAFSDKEVNNWIEKNIQRYEKDGFSYFALIEKNTGEFIGVAGPLIETIFDEDFVGIAYIIGKKYWKKGYGYESAKGSLNYATSILETKKVIAEIRPNNISSINIAKKLGMEIDFQFEKYYNGKYMTHLVYAKYI